MATPYTENQLRLLEELMPQIILALTTADNAGRGYGYSGPGVGKAYDITPAQGLANIRALELGALLDKLNDWCWCENAHDDPCPEPQKPPPYCPRCNGHHAREGDAEEKCQRETQFARADHRRRGGVE